MLDLQKFVNQDFGEIRTINKNDKILFCGTDIARALGYAIPSKAINTHCKGVSKMEVPTTGGIQTMLFITEGDVYRLCAKSKLSSAERFESWIFDEVLPQIRKTGGYIPVKPEDDEKTIMARGYVVAMKTIEKKDELINQLFPKATAFDDLMSAEGYFQFIDVAQAIEVGRTKLFDFLREKKVLTKQSNFNVPYGRFASNGYFKVVMSKRNGHSTSVTLISPLGLRYIYKLIKKNKLENEFDTDKLLLATVSERTVA
jgi:prophage antirepressor-like protein